MNKTPCSSVYNINMQIGSKYIFDNIELVKETIKKYNKKEIVITTKLQLDE